ncbi:MAG: hypothetical protein Q4F13_14115 [Pseudomonadota bacterium]|nr:hypothetical protein [Pseudomonadota bacterium]
MTAVASCAGPRVAQDAHRKPDETQSPTASAVPAAQVGVAAPAVWDSARIAADPQRAYTRAMAGFEKAAATPPPKAGMETAAIADAPANARTALERQDIDDPKTRQTLRTSLLNLGNAIEDGRFDPNTSNKFRMRLRELATAASDSNEFKAALAHLNAATRVLDQNTLAPGTKLAFDPEHGTHLGTTGLPDIDQPNLDADLYYKTADGKLHVDSSKSSVNAVASEAGDTADADRLKKDPDQTQLGRQRLWREAGQPEEPRRVGIHALDDSDKFHGFMDDRKLDAIRSTVGHPDERSIVLGDRAYSPKELDRLDQAAQKTMRAHVEQARQAHLASGQPASSFKFPYTQFVRDTMPSPEAAMQNFGVKVGRPVPLPLPATGFDMPTARQGGLWGGAASLGVSSAAAWADGRLTGDEARQIGRDAAVGAGTGALAAAGERVLTPRLDRALGPGIQNATQRAATHAGQSAAASATTGAVTRTVATRALGATAVGAAVSTGISAYENRQGLARGDAKAIGNVAADTAVAAGSIAAAAATGAAVGSVVPVAGTLVGGAVGLAVGVGVAYGAQVSGARDWLANQAAKAVDQVKSWF